MPGRTSRSLIGLNLCVTASIVLASDDERPIQDNSFLVEEAYNQEAGVVQHISTYARSSANGPWLYTLTEEWPAGGQTNQVGFTVPLLSADAGTSRRTGIGDVALNYRLQVLGNGSTRAALAPRLSLMLPTGDESRALGAGGMGVQVNVPASLALGSRLVTHWNLGGTWFPDARDQDGDDVRISALNVGSSAIWLVHPKVNLMLEAVWTRVETAAHGAPAVRVDAAFVNPGLRWAIDTPSGLQIVPGVAVPIGVGPSAGEEQVFVYLSFEHALKRRASIRPATASNSAAAPAVAPTLRRSREPRVVRSRGRPRSAGAGARATLSRRRPARGAPRPRSIPPARTARGGSARREAR